MNPQPLINFMKERHAIYLRRAEGKPWPWTKDKILQEGRFCNVFRELDTVTIWIRKNIREPYANHEHLWFMICIARYINWPGTLRQLIDTPKAWPSREDYFQPCNVTKALEERANWEEKVYTGAYMIRAESDPNKEWYSWSKHKYIAEIVLGRLWEDRQELRKRIEGATTLKEVHSLFENPRYIGWGPFMAYEVVTDLRHTRYLRNASDICAWANAGPGALRGLNRLHGRSLNTKISPRQANEEMRELLDIVSKRWRKGRPQLEMRDIEHSLCEVDKYLRVKLKEGKMRAKYRPPEAS